MLRSAALLWVRLAPEQLPSMTDLLFPVIVCSLQTLLYAKLVAGRCLLVVKIVCKTFELSEFKKV